MKPLSRLRYFLLRTVRQWSYSTEARGAGLVFIAQSVGAGLSLLVHVLLARWTGPSGYGTYSYALAWASMLSIGVGLGFPEAVLRFIPSYEVSQDWSHLRGIVRKGVRMTLLISFSLSILATAGLWIGYGIPASETMRALLFGFWLLPLVALIRLYSETCRAVDQIIAAYLVPRLLRPLIVIGGLALLFYLPGLPLTGTGATILFGLACLPIVLIQRRSFRRQLTADAKDASFQYETRRWMSVGLPLLLVTGFVTLIQQTDLILIGWMLNIEAAGLYKAAVTTATPVGFVLGAVNAIAAPRFSRFHADENPQRLHRFVRSIAHWLFWPTLGIGIIIAAGAEFFLGLFGPDFVAARLPLLILILSHTINAGAGSVGYLLNMTGHHLDSARVYGLTALINLGANVLGIYFFDLIGAAAATTLSMLIWNVWLHALVKRRLQLAPSIVSTLHTRS